MAPAPPWMDLPRELITTISTFLSSNPLDVINFRSVCKSFHSSLPFPCCLLSPFYPLVLPSPPPSAPPPPPPLSSTSSSCYVLTATSIFSIRPQNWLPLAPTPSACNWVVFFDELNHGNVTIRRPFTSYDFVLPLDFPTKLYLSHFEFHKLGMFYNICYVDSTHGKFVKKQSWSSNIDKVVVFGDGVGLVSLYGDGKLAFLRFGNGCKWLVLDDWMGLRFDDIVEFNGRVLGIDREARVYEMVVVGCDDMSLKLTVVVGAISCGGEWRKRLIESFGCLYLVVRMDDGMREFRVYEMNERVNKWVKVDGIGNRVFLFGLDFSVAFDADKFEGNCIVFYNPSFAGYNSTMHRRFPCMNPRFSDLPVSIYWFEAGAKIQDIKSLPSYSSLFWPPPTWIWPSDKLKLCGTFANASDRLLKGILDDQLKANYQELSFPVRAIVADDDISQQELLKMLENVDVLHKFLNDIVQEVQTDIEIVKSSIIYGADARSQQTDFMNNQEGTSSCNAKDKNGSEDEWLWNEISQRLGTHFCLKTLLNGLIIVFNRNGDKFQTAASASASAVEEERIASDCTDVTK